MNTTIKLSVSSVLLAGFMTGCSQQQFHGGGQQIVGGSQVAGGGQIAGGQQVAGGSQLVGGQQVAGGSQVTGGSQIAGGQQIMGGGQSVGMDSQIQKRVVTDTHSHYLVQSQAHTAQTQERVYVPTPEQYKKPAVVMFKEPKQVAQAPVIQRPAPVVRAPAPVVRAPAPKPVYKPQPVQRPKPVVQHRGIGLPPAQPGQCFAKVKEPAKFKNVVKRVQVSPATSKRVLVRGPQYRWVNKKVLARPATTRHQYIPAQYRNVTKKVLVKPAHYKWERGKQGPVTRIDNMTGEIMCRVKVPAVYRMVTQRVVARPAQRIKRAVPAVYKTVKQKQFVAPAQYKTVRTPARYVNKTYRVKVNDVRYSWKPIACKAPKPVHKPQTVSYKPKPTPQQSAEQRRLKQEFDRQQQILKQQWMQQEAQRKREAAAKQRKIALQRQQAQLQKHRQAQAAQQRQQAQHMAHLAQQRKLEEMRAQSQGYQAPAYAQPKPKVTHVSHTPTPRPEPKVVHKAPTPPPKPVVQQAQASDDKAPLTRANAVYRIQKALQQRGFNPGPIDGRLGPNTVKALTAFQETQGLKTGTLNRETLKALNLV